MASMKIPKMEFEFFYLTELTQQKIKPLSRWEKPLPAKHRKWLKKHGLKIDTIERRTAGGGKIGETVFSTSQHCLDYYRKHFEGSLLNKLPDTQLKEGFLFGYPRCCVDQFIRKPYSKNNISPENQKKLFHWACPGCRATPELLPYYQKIYDTTWKKYYSDRGHLNGLTQFSPQKLSWAAALALCLSSTPLLSQVIPDSSHYIPVPRDLDQDYLADAEEIYLGTNFFYAYTFPGVTDNIYWTGYFKYLIDTLATTPQTDRPYREDYYANGLEICQICGAQINMGFVRIINPMRQLQQDIPFMGLHFLDCHCFSYDGTIHSGRVDVGLLKKILYPYQPSHILSVAGDTDHDGLTDMEEDSLNFDPGNRDTNGDSIPDGAEVAEQLTRLLPRLKDHSDQIHTHFVYHPLFGIENCTVCGAELNMGHIEFINPENGRTFQIHFNGLHTLAHGGFAYDGTAWPNQRANAVQLYRTMKTHSLHIENDSDDDGLTDDEELHFGFDPNVMDSDGDNICDGMDLALQMNTILEGLPTQVVPNGPYVIHHPTFGHWNCLLCGEAVNMGFMELFNLTVATDPLNISYYAHHFLKKGSFAYEGRIDYGQWMDGRLDPIMFARYLELVVNTEIPRSGPVGETFLLEQNYPNPFNSETMIRLYLSRDVLVEISIFNILGENVRSLCVKKLSQGNHTVRWDGTDDLGNLLPSGIYVYQFNAGQTTLSKKMFLLR